MYLESTPSTWKHYNTIIFLCYTISFHFWLDMAAEEYNAFFYTLVSTVSPQANILYLHRGLILIRHLAFSLAGLRGFSYVSVLEGSKIFWPTGSLFACIIKLWCAQKVLESMKKAFNSRLYRGGPFDFGAGRGSCFEKCQNVPCKHTVTKKNLYSHDNCPKMKCNLRTFRFTEFDSATFYNLLWGIPWL